MTLQEKIMMLVAENTADGLKKYGTPLRTVYCFQAVINPMFEMLTYGKDLKRKKTAGLAWVRYTTAWHLLGRKKEHPVTTFGTLNSAEIDALNVIFDGIDFETTDIVWDDLKSPYLDAFRVVVREIIGKWLQKEGFQ